MCGRELGDTRTHLGFCRSSCHRRLGAAGDLDFSLDGTASGGFFLHPHDGSLGLDFCDKGCAWVDEELLGCSSKKGCARSPLSPVLRGEGLGVRGLESMEKPHVSTRDTNPL